MVEAKKQTKSAKKPLKRNAKVVAEPKAATKVLVLRTCDKDLESHGGFQWPESGPVECADWSPVAECGNGLHGLLWAVGNFGLLNETRGAKYLVVEVDESDIVAIGSDKVKFPRGNVVLCTPNWWRAFRYIRDRAPKTDVTSATGYSGHASATGDYGHASATGYYGHASATGDYGHASATGNYGHASATGDYGHASAIGNSGHASATGDYGHASATGNYGIGAALGYSSRAKAGKDGAVICVWHDGKRPRVVVGYIGEDGIKADTWYRADNGKLVEAT